MISYKGFIFRSVLLLISVALMHSTCTHEANISDLPEVCFTADVLPVFQNNCSMSGCHDGSGESEFSFRTYAEIIKGIIPGNSGESEIYLSLINYRGERMPPGESLSMENRMMIRVWIDQGAAETTCRDEGRNGLYVSRACFSRDILPVIVSHCATSGCHDAVNREEGYNFTNFTGIRNSVTPGSPNSSKLFEAITESEGEDKMPPAGRPQLTISQIDSIRKWIIYGALDENCGESCDTINDVTFSATIFPIIQSTCAGCHSGNAPSGNVSLSSFYGVAAVSSSGLLLNSLKGTSGVTKMPPSGTLSQCRVRQFEIWVENGHLNN